MRTFSALVLATAAELCLCCALPTAAHAQFAPFYGTQPYLPNPAAPPQDCPRAPAAPPTTPFPSAPQPSPQPQPQPLPQPAPQPLPPPTEMERPGQPQPESQPGRERQPEAQPGQDQQPQQPQADQQQQPQQPQPDQQQQQPQQPQADNPANPAAANPADAAANPEATPGTGAGETGDAFTSAAGGEGAAAAGAAGEAGPSGGATMLGRADSGNRFNLFDNMTAYPLNRVWFQYQHVDSFQTGIGIDPSSQTVTHSFAPRRDEHLYRVGAEITPFATCAYEPRFSIAFQTQYIASTNTDNSGDAWGTPEIILKYALVDAKCFALSGVLGIEPQVSTNEFELHEKTTRVLPGLLFYDRVCCCLFVQGGVQFSIPERNAPTTFDWALSAGYWLYADDCLTAECTAPDCRPCIVGLIPQVELLGKHVTSHETSNPFDIPADPTVLFSPPAPYREPRNVVDLTGGVQVLFGCGLSFSAAASVPLTGGQVRRAEFLTALNYCF